jgi:hypothetical protein
MRRQFFVLTLLFTCLSLGPGAEAGTVGRHQHESASACTAPEARQFDFWIGEWRINQTILQADGSWLELAATTNVTPSLNGCALIEHWQGKVLFFWEGMKEAEPLLGLSVRSFDPKTGKWFIYWMDSRNRRFGVFEGKFKDGKGEFFRSGTTRDGKPLLSRITFSGITETAVAWELAISTNEGKTWQALWKMDMKRQQ